MPRGALWVGPNVNMVSGTTWPDGDPFLQRQNEPSIAVSTRNTMHLMGFANDYRSVDLPGLPEGKETGDAWLGVFHSLDGGLTWRSTLLPGYPQDQTIPAPALWGFDAAADPVVRAGTQGLFYLSGIVFDRGDAARSAVFVSRAIDLNNLESGDPIAYIGTTIVKSNAAGDPFIDKPWMAVDVPRAGAQTVTLDVPQGDSSVSQTIQCGNVYLAWAEVQGVAPNRRSAIMFSRSRDCGSTWDPPLQLSAPDTLNQGVTIAVSPTEGHVWVAWRQFDIDPATAACAFGSGYWMTHPDAWPLNSITMGGVKYKKAQALKILKTPDQGDATYILASQLIPAKLNAAAGVSDQGLQSAINESDLWLVSHPLGTNPDPAEKQEGLALARVLKAYNEGLLTADGCASSVVTPSTGNAMVAVRSIDSGVSFSSPTVVSPVFPFEQGTTPISFRTNAYPTITVGSSVGEPERAYLAWTTRGEASPRSDALEGDGRIVVSTSTDGATWTPPNPIPIDQPMVPGHQLEPSISFAGGKVTLVYYDLRRDFSGLFERFIADWPSLDTYRHTVDIRVAQADAGPHPEFTDYTATNGGGPRLPSDPISRYLFVPGDSGEVQLFQVQFNPPNLPLFVGGTLPFFGDYIDLSPSPSFIPDGSGGWKHNAGAGESPVFHAAWTDNRDVEAPHDGNWSNYVPPTNDNSGGESIFDSSQTVPNCETIPGGAGQTRIRNQNIYTASISRGLFVGSPGSSRPSGLMQRAYIVFVRNDTLENRAFRLEISAPTGTTASFEQFEQLAQLELQVAGLSSASRTVFVSSTEDKPMPAVGVNVVEIASVGGPVVSGGLTSSVLLNPDPTNPPPADPQLNSGEDYSPGLTSAQATDVSVHQLDLDDLAMKNLSMMNLAMMNLAMMNLSMMNLAMMNLAMMNLAMMNLAMMNPALTSSAIYSLAMMNPAMTTLSMMNLAMMNLSMMNLAMMNLSMMNASVTDVTWEVTNTGTANAAYSFNMMMDNLPEGLTSQLLIYRLYKTPVADGCELVEEAQQQLLVNVMDPDLSPTSLLDPGITESDLKRATFWMEPGDHIYITLRVLDPDIDEGEPFDPSELSAAVVAQAVNTDDAANGDTQPAFDEELGASVPPLVITTTSLPSGVVGSSYSAPLTATGGTGPYVWSAFPALPQGLTLSSGGLLSGTPNAAGTYTFTARVTDGMQLDDQVLTLTITGLIVGSTAPPNVIGGQPFSILFHVEDVTGAPLPGADVTLSLGATPCSGASLSGSLIGITGATGNVTFSDLAIDRGGVGYTIIGTVSLDPYNPASLATSPINVEGFCDTGNTGSYRWRSSVTKLADGRVLIAGGMDSGGNLLDTAEIYDPSAGVFTPTAGHLSVARNYHQGVLLPSGKVLIVGGYQSLTPPGTTTTVAELFDPAGGGTFTQTSGSLSTGRVLFTATWVPAAGKVLITGGGMGVVTASAEVYDPLTDSFTPTGPMNTERSTHTATLLDSGNVLVVGGGSNSGASLASAELWDPTTGLFTFTDSLTQARQQHGAVKLLDGRALLLGGISYSGGGPGSVVSSAEIYDPATGTFSDTTVSMATGRFDVAVAPLLSGKVLAVGGQNNGWLHSAEVFDPAAGTFSLTGNSLLTPYDGQAIALSTNKVLAVSYDSSQPAQLFYPTPPTVFMVTNTNDSGAGSLRQAILDANAHPGLDAIYFDIPSSGTQMISLASPLPVITDPVWLDATTQPVYSDTPLIRIDGATLDPDVTGIPLAASNSVVQGFMVTRCPGVGIDVIGSSGSRISKNFVGTDGTSDLGNGSQGISIKGGASNIVTGNLISANKSFGIDITSGATNTGFAFNKVGTDVNGTVALGNTDHGLVISGSASGTSVHDNVISGNGNVGILIDQATGSTLQGNWIGTNPSNPSMDVGLGNGNRGIQLLDADGTLIGGSNPAARNFVVGNHSGIGIADGSTNTRVDGNLISGSTVGSGVVIEASDTTKVVNNLIGTDADGTAAMGNNRGMIITGDSINVVVGGSGGRNIISGNRTDGIYIAGTSVPGHSVLVENNYIGTDISGTLPIPNQGENHTLAAGIITECDDDIIRGNLISGNVGRGVFIWGGSANLIENNRIGTTGDGAAALGNGADGVLIAYSGGTANTIQDNLISGNGSNGVTLDTGATGTLIQGNTIGTNAAGAAPLGNHGDGIGIYNGTSGNIVSDNVIAASTYNGVRVNNSADGNTIRHNWIGTNVALASVLGNAHQGISVEASDGTIIGGLDDGDGNVVAYNAQGGISLESSATNTRILGNVVSGNTGNGIGIIDGSTLTTVFGNRIGTDPGGTVAMSNTLSGVSISASNNVIGDYDPPYAFGNTIAFNGARGVEVVSGSGNEIVSNQIFGNASMGIYLGPGANGNLKAPVITSAVDNGTNMTVTGTVNLGAPGATAVLQFFANDACDSSGYGQGQTLVGTTPVGAGGDGTAGFTASLPSGLSGKPITATTSTLLGLGGSTSGFSACFVPNRVLWARQFGGVANTTGYAFATDGSAGYLTGLTSGAFSGQTFSGVGYSDAYVRKVDLAGNELWARQFGIVTYDSPKGLVVDSSGVYVAGHTTSTLPGQTNFGGQDAFVRKYDLAGNELWTSQFGSDADDYIYAAAIDATGVYVAGYTGGALPGQTSSGGVDAFVRKYATDGTVIWTRQFGGEAMAYGVSVDTSGVYIVGGTYAALPDQVISGIEDAFVRKYDLAGNPVWTSQFGAGAGSYSEAWGVSIDASGVYLSGRTNGALPGQSSAGSWDGFVRKYDLAGTELWTRQFGTAVIDLIDGKSAVDATGLYISGHTAGALSGQTNSGDTDAFVTKFSPAGTELWTSQFGSVDTEVTHGVSLDTSAVYVVGTTLGTLPDQTSNSGGQDGFVRKYDFDGNALWTSQFGTTSSDAVYESSVDASAVYVAGHTDGALPGQTISGGSDAFARAYDLDGNELWTNQFGTSSADSAYDISVDSSAAYVVGYTGGVLPGQSTAGGWDCFVRKYTLSGTEVWTRQFGTNYYDLAEGISGDASGVYVTGYTQGTLPGQTGSGSRDAFVRRYDLDGTEEWTSQFGTGTGTDIKGISVDASSVYAVGWTDGTLPGQTSSGGEDAFVRKYDLAGNPVWTRQFGSADNEAAMAVSVDASGVYVTGYTEGTLPGQTSSGSLDAFVRKYDTSGNEVWTRQFGGADFDAGSAISVDASGAYVAGSTFGTLPGQTSSGGRDAFVCRYDLAGNELWCYQFGTASDDLAVGIAVDDSGVYAVGQTDGTLPGQISEGGTDAFIVKLVKW